MSNLTDPLPPVPQFTPPVDEGAGALKRFHRSWMAWFLQARDKINVINQSLVSLGIVSDIGFLAKQADGSWASRSISGTNNRVDVSGGNGSTNVVVDLIDEGVQDMIATFLEAGSGVTLTYNDAGNKLVVSASGGGGGGGVGSQIGYAYTESTTVASNTSTTLTGTANPTQAQGITYPSLDTTYTPVESTSYLDIEVFIPIVSGSGAGIANQFALFRDSETNPIATSRVNTPQTDYNYPMTLRARVPANAVAATTFKLRWGVSSGTGYILRTGATNPFFGGNCRATLIIREIKQ